MSEDSRSCPSCGARVPPGASVCDLCGTPIEEPESSDEEATDAVEDAADGSEEEAPSAPDSASEEAPVEAVYCHQCGWESPPGANFCSRCGTELQDLTATAGAEGTRPVSADLPGGPEPSASTEDTADAGADEQAEMGRQILLVVGTALVLVLVLFFATQWSRQYEWGGDEDANSPPAAAEQQSGGSSSSASSPSGAPPTDPGGSSSTPGTASSPPPADLQTLVEEVGGSAGGPVAGRIDSLRALVDGATGEERRERRAELARLYVGAGVPGRAALVQSKLADQTGRVEDRRRAANLLYKWMRQVEQQEGRAAVADVARHVAEAYAAVAEERPQDLDARTRMGEAYLLTNNPMEGIQAINQVLEEDSTFVPARFQKGLALLQINRLDQAVQQFERVMAHASQDDPFYQQAKKVIEVIRKKAGSSQGRSSAGGKGPSGS